MRRQVHALRPMGKLDLGLCISGFGGWIQCLKLQSFWLQGSGFGLRGGFARDFMIRVVRKGFVEFCKGAVAVLSTAATLSDTGSK